MISYISILLCVLLSGLAAASAAAASTTFKVCGTQYWKPIENTFDVDADGNVVKLAGDRAEDLSICDPNNAQKVIGTRWVSSIMLWKCCLEGTCQLATKEAFNKVDDSDCTEGLDQNGDFHSYDGLCFSKLPSRVRWGYGSRNNGLVPFVSVVLTGRLPNGTNISPDRLFGRTVLVKELKGRRVPGTKLTHNGCVRVDDSCGTGCDSCRFGAHLDLFVGRYSSYLALGMPDSQTVTLQRCTLLNYGL